MDDIDYLALLDENQTPSGYVKATTMLGDHTTRGVKMEWVCISDELPEFHKEILFYVDGQLAVMKGAFYRNNHKFKSYGKYTEAAFYKDEVTHWMPLPEPPKEN